MIHVPSQRIDGINFLPNLLTETFEIENATLPVICFSCCNLREFIDKPSLFCWSQFPSNSNQDRVV
jgi:hypothetical protein